MTKKAPPKRTNSYGPRLPHAPTKKDIKAKAKQRKASTEPLVNHFAKNTQGFMTQAKPHKELPGKAELREAIVGNWRVTNLAPGMVMTVINDSVDGVGQQAVTQEQAEVFLEATEGMLTESVVQPIDLPVQITPGFQPQRGVRAIRAYAEAHLSPKQKRAKQRLEDGTGWKCLGCMRVLHPRLKTCPYCSLRGRTA